MHMMIYKKRPYIKFLIKHRPCVSKIWIRNFLGKKINENSNGKEEFMGK